MSTVNQESMLSEVAGKPMLTVSKVAGEVSRARRNSKVDEARLSIGVEYMAGNASSQTTPRVETRKLFPNSKVETFGTVDLEATRKEVGKVKRKREDDEEKSDLKEITDIDRKWMITYPLATFCLIVFGVGTFASVLNGEFAMKDCDASLEYSMLLLSISCYVAVCVNILVIFRFEDFLNCASTMRYIQTLSIAMFTSILVVCTFIIFEGRSRNMCGRSLMRTAEIFLIVCWSIAGGSVISAACFPLVIAGTSAVKQTFCIRT